MLYTFLNDIIETRWNVGTLASKRKVRKRTPTICKQNDFKGSELLQ